MDSEAQYIDLAPYCAVTHAVVVLLQDGKFDYVNMDLEDPAMCKLSGYSGTAWLRSTAESGCLSPGQRENASAVIMEHLAGPALEHMINPDACIGDRAEVLFAYEAACTLSGSSEEAEAYLEWLWLRTARKVKACWPLIMEIGEQLSFTRSLPAEYIKVCLDRKLNRTPEPKTRVMRVIPR